MNTELPALTKGDKIKAQRNLDDLVERVRWNHLFMWMGNAVLGIVLLCFPRVHWVFAIYPIVSIFALWDCVKKMKRCLEFLSERAAIWDHRAQD